MGPPAQERNPLERGGRESRRRARRRQVRRRRLTTLTAGLVLLAGVGAWLGRGGGETIPPGVAIGGIDVGGRSVAGTRAVLEARWEERRGEAVSLTSGVRPGFESTVAADVLASGPRIDQALREALDSRGFASRMAARMGLSGERRVPLRYAIQPNVLEALAGELEDGLREVPVGARVRVKGRDIVTLPSRPGRSVDRGELTRRLEELPTRLEVPLRVVAPPVDDDDARTARDLARRIVPRPRKVTYGDRTALVNQRTLLRALRFPAAKGRIDVRLDADVLRAALRPALRVDDRAPTDATLVIRGTRVAVVPSSQGRRLDTDELGRAIVAKPDRLEHVVTVATTDARFTTEEARGLRIEEQVASFSTSYDCCPPRVTNIRRAAAILDGTIIPDGGRFSLNQALGPRTRDRGFVEAPTIQAGRLVDSVGGGVSQVATTLYNTAFFAGMELVAHSPHQFYISRYPTGREATISAGGPELVFRNDWPAAVLVDVAASANAVTVTFYSSKLGRRVTTTTGEPFGRRAPKTVELRKPDLEPGTRRVVQSSGSAGFTVEYTRRVSRGRRLLRDERFRTNYEPQNAIVEVGPPVARPEPTTTGPPSTSPAPPAATVPSPP